MLALNDTGVLKGKNLKHMAHEMKESYVFLFMILLSARASSIENLKTKVVSLAFCESSLPPEDEANKKTLDEVHTYAELKNDHRANLPDSFTVCSTIMTTGCQSSAWPVFFSILDNSRDQFLAATHSHGFIESMLRIGFNQRDTPMITGKLPPLFPNRRALLPM